MKNFTPLFLKIKAIWNPAIKLIRLFFFKTNRPTHSAFTEQIERSERLLFFYTLHFTLHTLLSLVHITRKSKSPKMSIFRPQFEIILIM